MSKALVFGTHFAIVFHRLDRPRKTTPQEDKKLVAVRNRVEHDNPHRDCVARMINSKWDTTVKVSDKTVSRRFREIGKGWKNLRRKSGLTAQKKAARVAWGKKYEKRKPRQWKKLTVVTDDKRFAFYTSKAARAKALKMGKKGMYRSADEGNTFVRQCHRGGGCFSDSRVDAYLGSVRMFLGRLKGRKFGSEIAVQGCICRASNTASQKCFPQFHAMRRSSLADRRSYPVNSNTARAIAPSPFVA